MTPSPVPPPPSAADGRPEPMTVADYTSVYADFLRMMVYLTLVTELSIASGVADDLLRRTFAAADVRWSAAMAPAIATAVRTTTLGGGA
jgi:hypothetical protein